MSVQNTFTQEQIQYLSERLFDVMAEDFDYNLKPAKRKALLAKVLGARNYDSLLQRSIDTAAPDPRDINGRGYTIFRAVCSLTDVPPPERSRLEYLRRLKRKSDLNKS